MAVNFRKHSDVFDKSLAVILYHEGGYVNHPKDPGGATNMGVTKRVYEKWIGKKVKDLDMSLITQKDVTPIYKKNYWDKIKGDKLPAGLSLAVFDFAVNAGVSRASKYLQQLVGVKQDGAIGRKTLKAVDEYVSTYSKNVAVKKYSQLRLNFYKRLKTFPTFGRGWLRRVDSVEQSALKIL